MAEKEKKQRRIFGRLFRNKNPYNLPANTKSNVKEYIEENQNIIVTPPFGQTLNTPREKRVLSTSIENKQKIDEYYEDPEIQKLMLVMLERTPQNIRWAFNNDTSVKSAVFNLSQLVKGSTGLRVKTKKDNLKNILTKFHRIIKVDTMVDKSFKDGICFAESVWWKDYENNLIIPKKLDYVTLSPFTNKFTGSKKWIQYTYVDSQLPENDGKRWKNYDPYVDYTHISGFFPDEPKDRLVKTHIMQDDVVNFQFFDSPPIVGLVEIIVWKKWLQYDAKLAGQKYATPLIKASVELPQEYDLNSNETTELLNKVSEDLASLMNFGVLAHPSTMTVEAVNQQAQSFDYVRLLEYADKYIHKAILMPSNLLDSTGSELATSRTTKDVASTVAASLGRMFIEEIKRLDLEYLDFIGTKVKEEDFELIFGEEDKQQRMSHIEEFNALMQMYDRGITKDANEVRGYVSKFGMDLEQFTEEELNLKKEEELLQQFGASESGNNENDNMLSQIMQDIKGGNNE